MLFIGRVGSSDLVKCARSLSYERWQQVFWISLMKWRKKPWNYNWTETNCGLIIFILNILEGQLLPKFYYREQILFPVLFWQITTKRTLFTPERYKAKISHKVFRSSLPQGKMSQRNNFFQVKFLDVASARYVIKYKMLPIRRGLLLWFYFLTPCTYLLSGFFVKLSSDIQDDVSQKSIVYTCKEVLWPFLQVS